MMAEYNT